MDGFAIREGYHSHTPSAKLGDCSKITDAAVRLFFYSVSFGHHILADSISHLRALLALNVDPKIARCFQE
jgi:hypothetical protein